LCASSGLSVPARTPFVAAANEVAREELGGWRWRRRRRSREPGTAARWSRDGASGMALVVVLDGLLVFVRLDATPQLCLYIPKILLSALSFKIQKHEPDTVLQIQFWDSINLLGQIDWIFRKQF
jgi:hypothetical protein